MDEYESLSHTKWDWKYHVVFIPKCRRRTIYGELRPHLGEGVRKLAQQQESRVEEGHLLADHVHMLISIPPKYAVSQVVGFIKGKSAIHLARVYGEKKRSFVGQHFWARGSIMLSWRCASGIMPALPCAPAPAASMRTGAAAIAPEATTPPTAH